jgi:hypothetical protein
MWTFLNRFEQASLHRVINSKPFVQIDMISGHTFSRGFFLRSRRVWPLYESGCPKLDFLSQNIPCKFPTCQPYNNLNELFHESFGKTSKNFWKPLHSKNQYFVQNLFNKVLKLSKKRLVSFSASSKNKKLYLQHF